MNEPKNQDSLFVLQEPKVVKSFTEPLEKKTAYRKTDPVTSQLAAQSQTKQKYTHDMARVYQCHLEHPEGLTDWELAQHLGMEKSTAGKRRGDLCKVENGAVIEQTSERRQTDRKRPAIVWRIKK